MTLSPEEIEAARKMHESARAYEQHHRQSGMILVMSFSIFLTSFAHGTWKRHPEWSWCTIGFGLASLGFIAFGLFIKKKRYEMDKTILQVLAREQGDDLPWIKEERAEAEVKKHMAAVKELEQELAKTRATP